MKTTELHSFFITCKDTFQVKSTAVIEKDDIGIYSFHLSWESDGLTETDAFTFEWSIAMNDVLYQFHPTCRMQRNILPEWWGAKEQSLTSYSSPLSCFYDGKSMNKYTWSLDECSKYVSYHSGAHEYTGRLVCRFTLPIMQFTGSKETTISIRTDARYIPVADAVSEVAKWWEDIGMKPAFVPACAKDPVYSFWYSFHQDISASVIEEECKKAKKLGFDVCIVDDGWCLAKDEHGYARSGVWLPNAEKFPDMKAHVQAVHDIGMKYILWFSTSFIGIHSDVANAFQGMILQEDTRCKFYVLDPRYKKVRDFILDNFVHAVKEWNLDGLKLDFIDRWKYTTNNPPYQPTMDIAELSDAVDRLMLDIGNALRAIKPDILIEFRQNYTGPRMRTYGNMFRVADCPNDYISNRIGVLDLRMQMRDSAVHSDMLMWNDDEKPETAALQMISAFFGTLQFSLKIDRLSPAQYKMSAFWLLFMKEHRALLQEGALTVYQPESMYPWAKSVLNDSCAVAVYMQNVCIQPDPMNTIYIANGCMSDRVLLELNGKYAVTVQNCYGEVVCEYTHAFIGMDSISVPVGGIITLSK